MADFNFYHYYQQQMQETDILALQFCIMFKPKQTLEKLFDRLQNSKSKKNFYIEFFSFVCQILTCEFILPKKIYLITIANPEYASKNSNKSETDRLLFTPSFYTKPLEKFLKNILISLSPCKIEKVTKYGSKGIEYYPQAEKIISRLCNINKESKSLRIKDRELENLRSGLKVWREREYTDSKVKKNFSSLKRF